MKIYRKIVHPYRENPSTGKTESVEGFEKLYVPEEYEKAVRNDIYLRHREPGESKLSFSKRFGLRFSKEFREVILVTDCPRQGYVEVYKSAGSHLTN